MADRSDHPDGIRGSPGFFSLPCGFYRVSELPAGMRPALRDADVFRDTAYCFVPGVPVADQEAFKAAQEFQRVLRLPGLLVFVQHDWMLRVVLSGTVDPHAALAPGFPAIL